MSVRDEILVLLHHYYPVAVKVGTIRESLNRRFLPEVNDTLHVLWSEKLIEGTFTTEYKLTAPGLQAALEIRKKLSID